MKNRVTTCIVGFLMLSVTGISLAQQPGMQARGPGGERKGGNWPDVMLERILANQELVEEIGLSEDQVAKLKDGAYELKKAQIQMQADMKLAALEQAKLIKDEASQESDIMAAVEKTGKIRTEVAKLHMKRLLMVRKTLTPEQQEKVRTMVHRHMKRANQKEHMRRPAGRDGAARERGRPAPRMEGRRAGPGDNRPERLPPPEFPPRDAPPGAPEGE